MNNYQRAVEYIEQAKGENANILNLSGLNLESLPESIGQLQDLTKLYLGGNQLSSLPESIGQLQNLSELDLYSNQLSSLPEIIGELQNLQELNLGKNRLSSLSNSIVRLQNLTHLDLHSNRLSSLPESIGQLQSLSKLDLHSNQLSSLPESIGELQNLQELNLGKNRLSSLPNSIVRLQSLFILFLYKNLFTSFSHQVCKLLNLRLLSFTDNNLKKLPESIGRLKKLEKLYVYNCQLDSLPNSIRRLKKLLVLNLGGNQFISFPEIIVELRNLTILCSEDNNFTFLPKFIGELQDLFVLDLRSNQLNSLPESIGQLQNLSELYLHSNQLSSLPASIGELQSLTHLDLRSNQLSSLPASIGELQSLTHLDLRSNQLNSLPASIKQLHNIGKFLLKENHFNVSPETWNLPIPEQIIEILKWQKARDANLLRPIHEAKVIFIGESNYGKTHLIELLREGTIKRKINTTHGIERSKLQIPYNEDYIDLNIWDLGGQEFMRSTHQFFFSERTVYVLVTLARRERNELNHWLKLANQLGNDAPVLIVINKIDKNPHDIDRASLQRDYPNIVGFVRTSINDCEGKTTLEYRNELYEKIQAIILDKELMSSVFEKRRPEWFAVKEELENLKEDYISYERYRQLKHISSLPEDEQKINLKLLSILGTVVSFVDDPRLVSTHVINPQWIMDGVYKIINDPRIKDEQKGRFEIKQLLDVLAQDRFPSDKHIFLLELMHKFNLCYQATDNRDIYFIPDLFEDIEPTTNWKETENTIAFRFNYDDFPPDSFMTRFIVEMSEKIIDNLRWRSGVYISNNTCHAKIYQSYRRNYINIEVQGDKKECRRYLYHIREKFKTLHKPFPKMEMEKNQQVFYKKVGDKEYWLNYQQLLKFEDKKISFYHSDLDEMIDVKDVLNGYATIEERSDEVQKELLKEVKKLTRIVKQTHNVVVETNTLLQYAITETDKIQYPYIFSLKHKRSSTLVKTEHQYEFQLYCNHEEELHKVGKIHIVKIPIKQIKKLIPYYNGALNLLKLGSPLLLPGAQVVLDTAKYSDISPDIGAAKSYIDKALNIEDKKMVKAGKPRAADTTEMEIIKSIIDKAYPNHSWKSLLKNKVVGGKVIWVCVKH